MAEIYVKVYEDNAGGIHAIVRKNGKVVNYLSHLEYDNSLTGGDLIDAAKTGFEYADDYDPDEFDGMSMEDVADETEVEPTSSLIAEIASDSVDLYFDEMGAEGHYLFGDGTEDEE